MAKKPQRESRAAVRVQPHHEWEFPVIFPPHPDELPEAAEEDRDRMTAESVCGAIDDSQHVELYDGTLGVTQAFVSARQAPVGQLQWNSNLASIYTNPGNVSGVRWCTGTLIAPDLFLSAGHCFDQSGGGWDRPRVNGTFNVIPPAEIATNMHVNFNYQLDSAGNPRTEQVFNVTQLVEYRLSGLDFAVIRLAGAPGTTFGRTEISTTDAVDGDMLCIIQHPAGLRKQIEAGPAFHLHDDRIGYDTIDTLGGSSGSGILRSPDGRIVGVHTNGGCTADALGHNHGVRITSIIAASPVIAGLVTPTLKFRDDGVKPVLDDPRTLKFRDDGVVKPVLDDPRTLKFSDDGGTLKHIDDVKGAGLDKQFDDRKLAGFDGFQIDPMAGRIFPRSQPGGAAPFVLSTPHHSMAWAANFPGATPQGASAGSDLLVGQIQGRLVQIEQMIQQGASDLEALKEEYRSLVAEYQARLDAMGQAG